MTFLDRLERHLGRFAIPGLIRYVVALNALVFALLYVVPGYISMLTLNQELIMQGQVWRIFSWLFIPAVPDSWAVLYVLALWWLWSVGEMVEAAWGTFRLNLYYLTGIVLCILSAFSVGADGGNVMLNLSVFLALATLIPNVEFLFFFVIPVKAKWLALISLIPIVLSLATGPLPHKVAIVLCLGNYLIFFVPHFIRQSRDKKTVMARRARFEAAQDTSPTLHRCEVCGVTEAADPQADFRVADDGTEYCTKHLPASV